MKKKSLRVLSLIVAIVMAISILPLAALAEETGPTRKVGVVVYGAELTTVLADMEGDIKALQNGEVPDLEEKFDNLAAMLTKLADGTGISVPDVDVQLTGEDGQVYKMEEDKSINIFLDTMELYVGFQTEIDAQITKMEDDIADLRKAMKNSNSLTEKLAKQLDEFDVALENAKKQIGDVKDKLVSGVNNMKISPNGILYRTYVTTEAVPANATYTVTVKGFSDTDKDGNAITRDGYVLYNDGLEAGGSMFNTFRKFSVTVNEKATRFEHDIQFVGPLAGIEGTMKLPDGFEDAYNGFVNAMNGMLTMAQNLKNKTSESVIIGGLTNFIADLSDTKPILDWFNKWTVPELSEFKEEYKNYRFGFPGLWCTELDAGFEFTNVDVAEAGITGSEYLLVNRDELVDVLKFMKELGKDAFNGALKATFGGTANYADGTTMTYEGITDLYAQLLKTEDGQISLDYDTAYAIVKTYMGVISDMNLFDRVVVKEQNQLGITELKLRYPIPAILKATSDENGVVSFTKDSNITLTWMLELIPQIMAFTADKLPQDNEVLQLLKTLAEYATKMSEQFADIGAKVINTLVYPFAQRLGLVGKKLASGNYIMFQTKAAEGYYVNPLAYTMVLTWDNDTWLYVTVADLGLITPYFTEAFHDFVRNTTFAGTLDKVLNELSGKDANIIQSILNDDIDLTNKTNQLLMGALTAFVTQVGFNSLGLDKIFATKTDFISGLNQYLYENGRTAQNLMVYVNKQALRAKSVYAGYVTADWYFYNLDKSPTLTATKLIDKSTKDVANIFVNEKKSNVVTKTGTAVSKVVNTIGTKIETRVAETKAKIKATIGEKVKSAAKKVVQTVASSVKEKVSSFFTNIFSRAGSGMITFDA